MVGPPGIEPGLYAPEAHVLPVYYGPNGFQFNLELWKWEAFDFNDD